MRHEVIKLTDKAIYPELIKLLSGNGDVWGDMLAEYKHKFKILFQNGRWTRAYPQYKADYTITDVEFIQKYGENTEPEAAPAWSFKTDEELAMFYIDFVRFTEKSTIPIEKFAEQPDLTPMKNALSRFFTSKRFHFQCEDGIVTNPEATVYFINGGVAVINMFAKDASTMPHCAPYFSTHAAALNHRRHNTPAIKLSDMTLFAETYILSKEEAENLVNERINGK